MKNTIENTRRIMENAHEMTRSTRRSYPDADYTTTHAAALAIAWTDAKAADNARAEWESMDGDAQHDRLIRMVYHRAKKSAAESNSRGEYRPNYYAWIADSADAESVVNEAYIRIDALLTANAESDAPRPLNIILARACDRAAQYIARQERKHANALKSTTA